MSHDAFDRQHDAHARELELIASQLRELAQGVDLESEWPDSLVAIARAAGPEAALILCDHFGGLERIYVPKTARREHPWSKLIGFEAHTAICEAFGGQQINVPRFRYRGLKKKAILELSEAGISNREIARRVRGTERYVRHVLSAVRDSRQLGLFGDAS